MTSGTATKRRATKRKSALLEGSPVAAWRVFAIRDDRLVPPFALRYWSEKLTPDDAWQPGVNTARCLDADHAAPDRDCTCGFRGTKDLSRLVAVCSERHFEGSEVSVLQECPVLALVELSGRVLPGADIPADDPESTVRAERAELLEVHLPAHLHPERIPWVIRRDHPRAYVRTYDQDQWPGEVGSVESAFVDAMRQEAFGSADLTDDMPALLEVARSMVTNMRGGLSRIDAALVLFDSPATPTWDEARRFVSLGVKHLAPEMSRESSGVVTLHGSPGIQQIIKREMSLARLRAK